MNRPTVDDYLDNGIYGQKQTKPDERRRFLGSLRERIVIALTQSQVREKAIYKEIQESLKQHPNAKLLLNGNMSYSYLSKYIKLADQHHVSFSMVTNKEHQTDIGLILAYDYAIDKEEIFVKEKGENTIHGKTKKKSKKSLFSSIKNKLF